MCHLLNVLPLVLLFSFAFGDSPEWNNNQKLRNRLLKNYDKTAFPQRFHNGTTNVYLRMYPRSITLDDKTETLITHSWIAMVWWDPRLKWDPKDFGNLRQVHFGDGELWKPDLTVYNNSHLLGSDIVGSWDDSIYQLACLGTTDSNAEISEIDHYGNVHFLAYPSGLVFWVPPADTKTYCLVDLKLWPFDEHQCNITLGSWTTTGWQVNLDFFRNTSKVHMHLFSNTSSQWNVLSSTKKRIVTTFSYYPEPFVEVEFSFLLKRNSPSFSAVVVVPAVLLPMMLMVQFILPVDQQKRMTLGFLCAVLVMIELLFMKINLPKVGSRVPLIVSYYGLAFVMVCLSIIINAILGRICHKQNPLLEFPPPEIIKRILTGPLSKILCISENASQVGLSGKMAEDGEILETGSKAPSYNHEWLLIAKAVDRIWLVVFVSVTIISMISFLSQLG